MWTPIKSFVLAVAAVAGLMACEEECSFCEDTIIAPFVETRFINSDLLERLDASILDRELLIVELREELAFLGDTIAGDRELLDELDPESAEYAEVNQRLDDWRAQQTMSSDDLEAQQDTLADEERLFDVVDAGSLAIRTFTGLGGPATTYQPGITPEDTMELFQVYLNPAADESRIGVDIVGVDDPLVLVLTYQRDTVYDGSFLRIVATNIALDEENSVGFFDPFFEDPNRNTSEDALLTVSF